MAVLAIGSTYDSNCLGCIASHSIPFLSLPCYSEAEWAEGPLSFCFLSPPSCVLLQSTVLLLQFTGTVHSSMNQRLGFICSSCLRFKWHLRHREKVKYVYEWIGINSNFSPSHRHTNLKPMAILCRYKLLEHAYFKHIAITNGAYCYRLTHFTLAWECCTQETIARCGLWFTCSWKVSPYPQERST